MLLVHGKFAIFLYNANDDNCVDVDNDSNDDDITKNEKCKIKAQISFIVSCKSLRNQENCSVLNFS